MFEYKDTVEKINKMNTGGFSGEFYVENITQKTTIKGDPYYILNLKDISGDIFTASAFMNLTKEQIGYSSVKIVGEVVNKGNRYVNITNIKEGSLPEEVIDLSKHQQALEELINLLKSDIAKDIARVILMGDMEALKRNLTPQTFECRKYKYKELSDKFRIAPGAVANHHAKIYGLYKHSIEVAYMAYMQSQAYVGNFLMTPVNTDILILGGLLHDLGKCYVYDLNNKTPIYNNNYGKLYEHLAKGAIEFDKIADDFLLSQEYRDNINHIILSHHGKKEYGSPVEPATLEAIIVNVADGQSCIYDNILEYNGAEVASRRVCFIQEGFHLPAKQMKITTK